MIAAEYEDDTDGQWKPCHEVRRWRDGNSIKSYCIDKERRFEIESQKVRRLEPKEDDFDLIVDAIDLFYKRCCYSPSVEWDADIVLVPTALSSVEENPETFECRVVLRNEYGVLATYKQIASGLRIENGAAILPAHVGP